MCPSSVRVNHDQEGGPRVSDRGPTLHDGSHVVTVTYRASYRVQGRQEDAYHHFMELPDGPIRRPSCL